MNQLTGYRILVVHDGKAFSLDDDADSYSMTVGDTEERPGGFLIGAVSRDCYWYIDNDDGEQQVLVTYSFDPEDVIEKPNEEGEVLLSRATIEKVEQLSNEPEIGLEAPISFPVVADQPAPEGCGCGCESDIVVAEGTKSLWLPASYLFEEMSFDALMRVSEPKRILRSRTVRGPSLDVEAADGALFFYFNFKSYPSTTGLRHRGYVKFLKPEGIISPDDARRLELVNCYVDCTCPDYRYRWAWANKQKGAGGVGNNTLNLCINRAPRITNPMGRPGLCKHLLALGDYVYGQSSTFPGEGPATKLGKVQRFANKRWTNFGAQMAQAKERAKRIKVSIDKTRQGAEREEVPDASPPDQWQTRISTLPVPEPPKIGEPMPEIPALPEPGKGQGQATPASKTEKPSFLTRLNTAAKKAGQSVATMTQAARDAEKSLLGEPDAPLPTPKPTPTPAKAPPPPPMPVPATAVPAARAEAPAPREVVPDVPVPSPGGYWMWKSKKNRRNPRQVWPMRDSQDGEFDGVCIMEKIIMDLHEAEDTIKAMKAETEVTPAPAPVSAPAEDAAATDPGSQVISLLSQILDQITILNQQETEEEAEDMEVDVPVEGEETEEIDASPEGEAGPPKLAKD